MARRIIIGIVLTLILFIAARRLTSGKPDDFVTEAPGFRVYHRSVTEMVGPGQPRVKARIEPAQKAALAVRFVVSSSDSMQSRTMLPIGRDIYEACLPEFEKGTKVRYWIEAANVEGARIRLPENPDKSIVLKYKGKASNAVIVVHILFMFAAFFFMVMSLFAALGLLRGRETKRDAMRWVRWVLASLLIGGWPFGFILNRQTFGPVWEGFPFGYDITDNKTQVMFVFWLVSCLLAWGSLIGRGEEKDRLGPRAFAVAIIVCFVVSLALFILPHSL